MAKKKKKHHKKKHHEAPRKRGPTKKQRAERAKRAEARAEHDVRMAEAKALVRGGESAAKRTLRRIVAHA